MELTLDEAFQKAVEAHKSGQVKEAERLYTAILKTQPTHPDANHNMGILAAGLSKIQEAFLFFKTALESNPSNGQFWLSYINALIKLNQIAEAQTAFDQAKDKGASGNAFDQLGQQLAEIKLKVNEGNVMGMEMEGLNSSKPNVLDDIKLDKALRLARRKSNDGQPEEAKDIYQDILQKLPKNKQTLASLQSLTESATATLQDPHLGQLQSIMNLYTQGQLQQALSLATEMLERFPESAILYNITGATNAGLKHYDTAINNYKKALKINPNNPDVLNNMGVALNNKGDREAAINSFKKALKIKPDYIDAYYNMGNALTDKGDLNAAISSYKQAIKLKPDFAIAYNNMGNALKDKGDLKAAIDSYNKALKINPNYAKAYNNIGSALKVKGDLEAAIDSYNKALKIDPDYADAYKNLGNALKDKGDLEAAIDSYKRALKINPDFSDAYNNMGITLSAMGDTRKAIDSYNRAIKINPDYAKAYNNLGTAFNDSNQPEAAIVSYNRALKIRPDYAEAYNNLGLALKDKGDLGAAIDSFKQALRIKSDFAEAYNNMGICLKSMGDVDAALDCCKQALRINPDYAEVYYSLGNILKGLAFTAPDPWLQEIITSLLDSKKYVRPRDVSNAATSLLKFEPSIKELLEKHSAGELKQWFERLISNLDKAPLLFKLMSVCSLPDLELENALTDIRSALLLSVYQISNSPEILRFQSALALQCFTNEYIYSQTSEDTKSLEALEIAVEQSLSNGQQPSPQSVLCLASYKALYHYKWSDLLNVTPDIEEVITRQIIEPKQENCLKPGILVLQEITNKVSSKVRDQYEESPYPRWVNMALPFYPVPIYKVTKHVNLMLSDPRVNDISAPNILIAGCGTGQHSIGTASRFKNAQVLAVDLSLSSLAYAKRKTEELGLQNIDYMQADILDLSKLDRKFDIIESTGVLHHMDDPLSGWRVLTDCLKPSGLMKIGLYSELARQHIVKMREEINQSGIGSNDLAMKSFRSAVVTSQEKHHKSILSSPDFYSLSTLRDLLFHVQEHRFTIPQIKKCLDELGLKFCGFEADTIVQDFKLTNTGKDDSYDLDKWASYEESTPLIFGSMYQFWCQKEG